MIESKNNKNQGVIHKLSQEVINKIAAGEIVQRPYSVVKELLENSIDAGSNQISVYLNAGGLDLIKIIDDGKGIHENDFPLLCERFATSKISKAEDLSNLSSFGFRGEALASISYVSNVTITSKQRDLEFGHQASFKDSIIIYKTEQQIDKIGCNDGTIIEVENLFHNLQQRRSSTSKLEEKKSVLKLIQYLSMHYNAINFKLFLDKNNEFSSTINQSREQLIAQICKISPNSLSIIQIQSQIYSCQCEMTFSKISSIKGRKEFVLFINDRLVECDSLKRAIDRVYQSFYQCVNDEVGGFFVYLSLKLLSNHIDPNVHPNKKEVRFINEIEITALVEDNLKSQLKENSQQKLYQLKQKQLPFDEIKTGTSPQKIQQDRQIIRVDPKLQTIDSFYTKIQSNQQKTSPSTQTHGTQILDVTTSQRQIQSQDFPNSQIQKQLDQIKLDLSSILKSKSKSNKQSQEFISNCAYVGCVTPLTILVQIKTKLIIISSVKLLFVYFLNNIISSLGQFNTITLQDVVVEQYMNTEMQLNLEQFFNIKSQQQVMTFPQITVELIDPEDIRYFMSQMKDLQHLNQLDQVFAVSKELAEVCSLKNLPLDELCQKELEKGFLKDVFSHEQRKQYDTWYRDTIFPFLKSKAIILDLDVTVSKELLSLESIYNIFERC